MTPKSACGHIRTALDRLVAQEFLQTSLYRDYFASMNGHKGS